MVPGVLIADHDEAFEQPDRTAPEASELARYSIAGYPVEELGGLVFGYLGPKPVPLLPRWEQLVEESALRSIGSVLVPCNWLQCMENGLDESHVEWLHGYFGNYMLERQGRPLRLVDIQASLPYRASIRASSRSLASCTTGTSRQG